MRLVPENKSVETPLLCFRYHRDYADATCPECELRIPGGPYDAEQYAQYFTTPLAGPVARRCRSRLAQRPAQRGRGRGAEGERARGSGRGS